MLKILSLLQNTNTSSSSCHPEEVWLRETAVEYHLVEIYQSLRDMTLFSGVYNFPNYFTIL